MRTSLKWVMFVVSAGGCLLFTNMAATAFRQSGWSFGTGFWPFVAWAAGSGWFALRAFRLRRIPADDRLPDSKAQEELGMIDSSEYEASRAIEIDEDEDEGMCYLLELSDGTTLCLRGQYLYEFEDASRFGQSPTAARFPNTRFQVKRREDGQVMELVPLGTAFHPLLTVPGHIFRHYKPEEIMLDGDITHVPFDQLIANKGRLPNPTAGV